MGISARSHGRPNAQATNELKSHLPKVRRIFRLQIGQWAVKLNGRQNGTLRSSGFFLKKWGKKTLKIKN
jgi:hypothetical protein